MKNTEEVNQTIHVYRGLHTDWWQIANCSMLLGESQRAREEFATAGLYVRALQRRLIGDWDRLEKEYRLNAGSYLEWGMYITVISGHSTLISAMSTDICSISRYFETNDGSEGESNGAYWRACTLSTLYRGEDELSREDMSMYSAEDNDEIGKLLTQVQKSLLDNDEQSTRSTLKRMVDSHEEMFGDSWPWVAEFSHIAAAHLLIARNHGMEILASELDSEYIPKGLDEYDIGDDFELPTPKYVDDTLIPN
ncbi:hypothetical protein [Haloarchaeobius sp. TZWSO28]|uniref:hypothetical protein n=1 Tax=Haloarchaeobius sp. TZWSO28 TaxID=3446119 RepID=UPI003EB7FE64